MRRSLNGFDEGMASLYETATAVPGYYFGEPNWRSEVFRELHDGLGSIRLADVITSPWFADEPNAVHPPGERVYLEDEQAYMLAYARLFMLYLQEKQQLIPVFEAFRYRKPPTSYMPAKKQAIALLETTLGKPIADVQVDFLSWVPIAYDPKRRFCAGRSIPRQLPRSMSAAVEAIEKELPNIPLDPSGPQQAIDRSDGH